MDTVVKVKERASRAENIDAVRAWRKDLARWQLRRQSVTQSLRTYSHGDGPEHERLVVGREHAKAADG